MFCWQARRGFADLLEGTPREAVRRHVDGCAGCRARLAGLGRVASLVAEAAGPRQAAADPGPSDPLAAAFAQRVLLQARARAAALRLEASISPAPAPSIASLLRPLPLGAALAVMLLAAGLTHLVDRNPSAAAPAAVSGPDGAIETPAAAADLNDRVAPPREVPFEVREDLVGTRRGRIPLTTYVLEPAPDRKPVLRASL